MHPLPLVILSLMLIAMRAHCMYFLLSSRPFIQRMRRLNFALVQQNNSELVGILLRDGKRGHILIITLIYICNPQELLIAFV